ncbi:MFS transporter [Terribacillus sp. DMT04]|uniref:MFS transporter n=1 Tax=Terribacillus sp. DMT04 TaxID=2850441 RepID=UPI001C2C8C81|nr:MFS transporter [Terribacillus sp. DMT04]QXE02478.1 MFS transporter [Terribacillus sp. DMT04]
MRNAYSFWILVSIVAISGFSQGLLLPLIAIIFEQDGLSSSLNGLNAIAIYIGILAISPFMEAPLRKFGYRPVIITGGLLVAVALFAFPLWKSFWFWFVLRLLIGIGDNALHFGTQTWITSSSPEAARGRNISIYGLFFGIGFAVGPLMTSLVKVSESLPFILSGALCLVAWFTLFQLRNEFPESENTQAANQQGLVQRFGSTLKYAWVAFLPPLGYGFLESSLNGSFPIYGLRQEIGVAEVSILLTSFAIGGIVFQIPLGMLSDKFGRKYTLLTVILLGTICFGAAGILEAHYAALMVCLFAAGMMLGSTFSLGISYMTDLTPRHLLPTGNLLCSITFSLGSLGGPYLSGVFIEELPHVSFFLIMTVIFAGIFITLLVHAIFSRRVAASQQY